MARDDSPPFEVGHTLYDGNPIDANDLQGFQYLGRVYRFEDIDYSSAGGNQLRSNRMVLRMVVRNVSAISLLPKRLVTPQRTDSGSFLGEVDGYADVTAEAPSFPIDEYLSAAGCPVNDCCYMVVEGPAMVLTDLAGGANNVFAIGDIVVALTAASSNATTAGRVKPQDLTGATAILGAEHNGKIGRALSAKTTANSNADLLIDIHSMW